MLLCVCPNGPGGAVTCLGELCSGPIQGVLSSLAGGLPRIGERSDLDDNGGSSGGVGRVMGIGLRNSRIVLRLRLPGGGLALFPEHYRFGGLTLCPAECFRITSQSGRGGVEGVAGGPNASRST